MAWINGDEGQFASIGKKPPLDKQSKTDTAPDKVEKSYSDLIKAFDLGQISEEILIKARSGIYANTTEKQKIR